jgi:hypothetical protein
MGGVHPLHALGGGIHRSAHGIRFPLPKGNESIAARKQILVQERAKNNPPNLGSAGGARALDHKLVGYEKRMLQYEKGLYHEPDCRRKA